MSDGSVVYEIKGEIASLKKSLNDATSVIQKEADKWTAATADAATDATSVIQKEADKWTGATADAAAGAKRAGSSMGDVLKGVLASDLLKQAGKAILDFGKESIAMASDLEEVQNVVDVTFGDDAGKINSWSKKALKAFGLSELQAKKFTSTMGAMLKSSGLSGAAVTDMSTGVTGLAADMASFYNLDHEDAFDKIRAGLSGETEPLKQLGINMSVANLEAFALAQGITKSYEAMGQAEQTQLRYNYLLQATADAQGDFARTGDGFANSTRTLENNFNTLKANLGEVLLPILGSAVTAVNGLFEAFTPEVTLTDTFKTIEDDYSATLSAISSKESVVATLVEQLTPLAEKTTLTVDEQFRWDAILKKLVETIPSLSEVVNQNTGELVGGVAAVTAHAKAWSDAAKEEAKAKALMAKQEALESKRGEVQSISLDYDINYAAWQKKRKEMADYEAEISAKYGGRDFFLAPVTSEEAAHYSALAAAERDASAAAAELGNSHALQSAALELEEGKLAAYTEGQTACADATDANAEANAKLQAAQAGQLEQLDAIDAALLPLVERQNEVREATQQQVDSVISGFENMGKVAEVNIADMIAGLESQIAYMSTYEANMKSASERGVNDGLLAALSDGSVQSAGYMAAIAKATDDEIIAMNENWEKTKQGKETFTTVLTDTKLKADEVYQGLVDTAKTKVAELDQSVAAKASMDATIQGLIDSMVNKTPEVQSRADEILRTVASLSGGVSKGGSRSSGRGAQKGVPLATGMEYVPYDGMPAVLHRGEAVLTAMEADAWRELDGLRMTETRAQRQSPRMEASAGAVLDYHALASAIWEAAPEGQAPVIALDGAVVGRMVEPYVSSLQGDRVKSGRFG